MKFKYLSSIGETEDLIFKEMSYRNLRDYLVDNGYEDFGDCKGRGLCGTCLLDVKEISELKTVEEQQCLSKQGIKTINTRLSCQISLDRSLNNKEIEFYELE